MKKIATSAELRARAIAAMKYTWKAVLMLVSVTYLPVYIINYLLGFLPRWLELPMYTVVTALGMVPVLGITRGIMNYMRGKALPLDCIRSMLPYAKQVIIFQLWALLCILGWITVGMGVMLLGMMIGAMTNDADAMAAVFSLVSIVAIIVLVVRAAVNYSMGHCIIVDDPNAGARNVLRRSKEMIRGYRWHYIKVTLPMYIGFFAVMLLVGLLPAGLKSLAFIPVGIAVNTMSHYFMSAMYEELRGAKR